MEKEVEDEVEKNIISIFNMVCSIHWLLSCILCGVFYPISSFIPSRSIRHVKYSNFLPSCYATRKGIDDKNGDSDDVTLSSSAGEQDFGWLKKIADSRVGKEESIYNSVVDYDVCVLIVFFDFVFYMFPDPFFSSRLPSSLCL